MAIRTKAELRAAIDEMLANNTTGLITPELDRMLRHDFVDTLLDRAAVIGGAGINVDQGDDGTVTVAAGGAAAAAGLPVYYATNVVQASDDIITADVAGLPGDPPSPSLFYVFMPAVLNRAADDLSIIVNGATQRALRNTRSELVQARLITPGGLYALLTRTSAATSYYLTEVLDPRPQDFDVAVFWSDEDGDPDAITENSAVDTFGTRIVTIPAYTGTRSSSAYLVFGVPPEAPDVIKVESLLNRGIELNFRQLSDTERASFTGEVGGEAYRWYRSSSRARFSPSTVSQAAGSMQRLTYEYL